MWPIAFRLNPILFPILFLVFASSSDVRAWEAAIVTDDASRLNQTRVHEIWNIPTDPVKAEAQLKQLLIRATAENLPVSIAGARHSMGGHTIAPDGIVVNMLPFNAMELDDMQKILHVGSGARWSSVVPYLDARGYSVWVMQSNNDFTVGGSISVNCHGWQHNKPPIASTVKSFRIMRADGSIVRCSRDENQELFSLALGGFGLFGIILDVELRVVPNEVYQPVVEILDTDTYVERFEDKVTTTADVGMVYGRLCVVPGEDTFLREAVLMTFIRTKAQSTDIPKIEKLGQSKLRRAVYRAQIGHKSGKVLRWKAEVFASKRLNDKEFTRNQLINESVTIFQERDEDRTDILHEYFVPYDHFDSFISRAQKIIPKHDVELLNVTVRNVKKDSDVFLRYADQDMFAFVMLYNMKRTEQADAAMRGMTSELIEAAISCEGSYYLPYRLHATKDQFEWAYPRSGEFFNLKRKFDPTERFQNQFYITYGKAKP
ncbi:MAG: FAD-binding oxidoreductase [Candidatus Hydrogenedentes bacterium]|nr:FAD-binding oxidoreductase [Candidatus Hydrogenedentota bacterium]